MRTGLRDDVWDSRDELWNRQFRPEFHALRAGSGGTTQGGENRAVER